MAESGNLLRLMGGIVNDQRAAADRRVGGAVVAGVMAQPRRYRRGGAAQRLLGHRHAAAQRGAGLPDRGTQAISEVAKAQRAGLQPVALRVATGV